MCCNVAVFSLTVASNGTVEAPYLPYNLPLATSECYLILLYQGYGLKHHFTS